MRVLPHMPALGRRLRLAFAFVGVGALAPACTPPQAPPLASAESGNLVQLGLSYTRSSASSATPTPVPTIEAEAHFVRFRAADRAMDRTVVASLLGLGNAARVDDALAIDACSSDVGEAAAAPSAGAIEVSLLDAGPLTVRTRDASGHPGAALARLEAQHYPELFPFVSGVVYGLEATPSSDLLPGARVEIEADGGEDVGPFLAAASLPSAFPELTVARDAASGRTELRWLGADAASSATAASVLIELRWSGAHPGTLHCRARDDGRFTIERAQAPGLDAALTNVGSPTGQASATLSVARSARAAMQAPGAGDGTLTVSLRDTVALLGAEQP